MNELKAKFKVGSVVDYGNQNIEANLTAVTGNSEENKTYSNYTPRADMKIHITNPSALDFFVAGEEYVAIFRKANDASGDAIMIKGEDLLIIHEKGLKTRQRGT